MHLAHSTMFHCFFFPINSFVQNVRRWQFSGNLCRCTGYRPILESFYSLSLDGCCQQSKGECACRKVQKSEAETNRMTSLTSFADFPSYDPSQEPIFPPQLIVSFAFENKKAVSDITTVLITEKVVTHGLLTESSWRTNEW